MICTIKEHYLWWKEIIFSPVPWWKQVEVPEDVIKELQECELKKVFSILTLIEWNNQEIVDIT